MTLLKRFLLSFLCLLLLLSAAVLQGCSEHLPITFSSILDIQADESGTRTMEAVANKKTLQALFHNSSFSFQSFITANCPKELEWSYIETASSYDLTFTLSFDSLDDYQQKIASLTGIPDFTTISRPQQAIKTGFTLSEQDNVMAVFSWFTDALMERTGLSSAKLSSYLTQLSNELTYNGRSYDSVDGTLYCAAETILDAEHIDILTDLSLDQWRRYIYIFFPDELMDNASNVKSYLESLVPQGMSEEWQDNTTWCLEFSASSFENLCILTNQLFQSSSKANCTESITAKNFMCIVHSYSEPLNISFFVPDSGETEVRYFFSTDTQAELAAYNEAGKAQAFPSDRRDYSGYRCIFDSTVTGTCTYNYDAVFQYQPAEISVATEIKSIQLLSRTITLRLGKVPLIHQELINQTISDNAKGYGIISQNTDDENCYILTFSQTGTPRHLTGGFQAVFHGNETLDYASDTTGLFEPLHTYQFTDSMDFSGFLADPGETLITCRLDFPTGTSILQEALTSSLDRNPSVSSSSYTAATQESLIGISMTLTMPNTAYYLCLMALLAIVAAILYAIYEGLARRR